LVGEPGEELGASLYLREILGLKRGAPPKLDLDKEKKLHAAVREAIRAGQVRSAHDLSEGGLLVALGECAVGSAKHLGADVTLDLPFERADALLFGETQSRALLTAAPDKADALLATFEKAGVPARKIGKVGGDALKVGGAGSHALSWPVAELYAAWDGLLPACLH